MYGRPYTKILFWLPPLPVIVIVHEREQKCHRNNNTNRRIIVASIEEFLLRYLVLFDGVLVDREDRIVGSHIVGTISKANFTYFSKVRPNATKR